MQGSPVCLISIGASQQAEALNQRLRLTAAELLQPMHDVDAVGGQSVVHLTRGHKSSQLSQTQ